MAGLFPGEALDIAALSDAAPLAISDNEIDAKYIKGDVRIVTEQARYPLTGIPSMLESGNYLINPEFQRRHRWDTQKKSRLVESFIMNVPVPPIFLYEDKFSHYEVMDGLQRLTAIREFYADLFALDGLTEWPELNGRTYSKLPEQVRRGVDRRYLSSIILLQETAKTATEAEALKQLVFERINSGGVQLEPQESRNAIYNGPLNALCIRLSRNEHLCRTWGIPEPDANERLDQTPSQELLENELYRKMDDVELVLRFFAYRQRLSNQKGALRAFLDRYLHLGNKFPKEVLRQLADLFVGTIALADNIFGESAFWLYRRRNNSWNWYQRPTTVIYDPLMYVLSQHLDAEKQLIRVGDQIRGENLQRFYRDNYALFEGRYTNLSNIHDRNTKFESYISQFL